MSKIEDFVIQKVKQMRTERGISQAELSRLIDLSEGFIGNVENPKQRAKYNLNILNELAKVFKCSPQDFLPPKPFDKNKPDKQDKPAKSAKPTVKRKAK